MTKLIIINNKVETIQNNIQMINNNIIKVHNNNNSNNKDPSDLQRIRRVLRRSPFAIRQRGSLLWFRIQKSYPFFWRKNKAEKIDTTEI